MNDDSLEERNIWQVNSPLFYNLVDFHTLDWPSLTCQWLPSVDKDDGKLHRLILGTHTEDEDNKLIIADYKIMNNDDSDAPASALGVNGFKCAQRGQFQLRAVMDHTGDVNRARYMPQDASVIATRSSENESFVYRDDRCVATLTGHSDEGYGLSWSGHTEGRLLTSSFDKTICSWDILPSRDGGASTISPTGIFRGHNDKVEDVSWHPLDANVFASVGDDKRLLVWDHRQQTGGPQLHTVAHSDEANCVSWHPVAGHLLLTGGSDECVYLWDRRKLVQCVHTFCTDYKVYRVAWAPLQETLFLSAGLHHNIHVWDIGRIGDDVLSHEEEDMAPPELVLLHPGHTDAVTDVDWHPQLRSTVASVSEDNALNVWQIKETIFGDD